MTYRLVNLDFWGRPEIAALPPMAQLLLIKLRTCRHANMIGCYQMSLAEVAGLMHSDVMAGHAVPERYLEALSEAKAALDQLQAAGAIRTDAATGYIWIVNELAYQGIPNPKAGQAALRLLQQLPRAVDFYGDLLRAFLAYANATAKAGTPRLCVSSIRQIIQSLKRAYGIPYPIDIYESESIRRKKESPNGLSSTEVDAGLPDPPLLDGEDDQAACEDDPDGQRVIPLGPIRLARNGAVSPKRAAATAMVEIWNAVLGGQLPKVIKLSPPLLAACNARLRGDLRGDLEAWRAMCRRISRSPFLMGRKTDFRASMHWVLKPTNWTKIENGNYDPADDDQAAGPHGAGYRNAKPGDRGSWLVALSQIGDR